MLWAYHESDDKFTTQHSNRNPVRINFFTVCTKRKGESREEGGERGRGEEGEEGRTKVRGEGEEEEVVVVTLCREQPRRPQTTN